MAVEWGLRQTATIGKRWISISIEEMDNPIEAYVVYQFNFTVPKVKWWQVWLLWRDFDSEKFVLSYRKDIAEKAGISPEEIKGVWHIYSPEARTLQVQIMYVPSTAPVAGILPAAVGLITLTLCIMGISASFIGILTAIKRFLGIEIQPDLKEIMKLVVTEAGKAVSWIAIPVSILGIGWVTSMVLEKKGG